MMSRAFSTMRCTRASKCAVLVFLTKMSTYMHRYELDIFFGSTYQHTKPENFFAVSCDLSM